MKEPAGETPSRNFLDQLVSEGMIAPDKKMFSIYIANDTDKSYSSIQFGGFDEKAFADYSTATKF